MSYFVMPISDIIRYYGWQTPKVLLIQHRWNRLVAKGFNELEICTKLGLHPLGAAANSTDDTGVLADRHTCRIRA